MYRIHLLLNVYYGPARGYRHESRAYLSDTIPDLCVLRQSRGVFDASVENMTTGTYTY